MMRRLLSILLCLVALTAAGCGSTKETCESIDWQGSQCEALDHKEMNKTLHRLRKQLAHSPAASVQSQKSYRYLQEVP
jgi:hypothetical protein